jgi:hypothetical protein
MSLSDTPDNESSVGPQLTDESLIVRPLDLQWQPRPGVVIRDVKTFGCGIGSEYVYCYSYPTYIEVAKLKQEQRFRIKVGKADGDPIGRIHQQIGGNRTALSELPVVLLIFQTLASRHLERWLHKRLERASDAGGSEWFYTSPDEIVELFRQYVRQASCP